MSTVSFKHVSFADDADFWGTRFDGVATFDDALFDGIPTFWGARFNHRAEMRNICFNSESHFTACRFVNGADFFNSVFNKRAHLAYTSFEKLSGFELADVSKCEFVDITEEGHRIGEQLPPDHPDRLTLENVRFLKARGLSDALFERVTWQATHAPRIFSRGRSWEVITRDELDAQGLDRAEPFALPPEHQMARADYQAAEAVYRGLRRSYEARRDHPRAGAFYFREMEMRRLASSQSRLGRRFGSITAWYGFISGYGELWMRPLVLFIGMLVIWAVLYLIGGLWAKFPTPSTEGVAQTRLVFSGLADAPPGVVAVTNHEVRIGHALLHSFLVATLIGRDAHALPINAFGETLQAVQIIVGPSLLGFMALALRRRFQR